MKKIKQADIRKKEQALRFFGKNSSREIQEEKEKTLMEFSKIDNENFSLACERMWKIYTFENIQYAVYEYIDYSEDPKVIDRIMAYIDFCERSNIKPQIIKYIYSRLFDYYRFSDSLIEEENNRFVELFKEKIIDSEYLPIYSEADIEGIIEDYKKIGFDYFKPISNDYEVGFRSEQEGEYYFASWYEAKKWLMG